MADTSIRVLWRGDVDASPFGRLILACRKALRAQSTIILVDQGPADVVVCCDGTFDETPARFQVHYPLTRMGSDEMALVWAATPWHQQRMPAGTPFIPLPDLTEAGVHAAEGVDWQLWGQQVAVALQRLMRPSPRRRLSVCVVADATPERLQRSLANVRGVADDLLVVHAPDDQVAADLASGFGARGVAAAVTRPREARNAALQHAIGAWILLVEAGETLTGNFEALRQTIRITPQGPDLGLLELHDGLSGSLGTCLAPRLLARGWPVRWEGPLRESVRRAAGGAVMVLPVGLLGAKTAPRPELRAALAALGRHLLRDSLLEVPDNPQVHHILAGRLREAGSWREAGRHFEAAVACSALVGRWPAYVADALEARAEIAIHYGQLEVAEQRLQDHSPDSLDRAEFWLLRARLDRLQGRLDQAAGAIGRAWEIISTEDGSPWLRYPVARQAADLCARALQWEACANWLVEAVRVSGAAAPEVAGWCKWLSEAAGDASAAKLATAAAVTDWQDVAPVSVLVTDEQDRAVSLTVIVVASPARPLARACLPSASVIADELLVVAPVGHQALSQAGAYAARAIAAEGDLAEAVAIAVKLATRDGVLLLWADEWIDAVGARDLQRLLTADGLPGAVAFDIHGVVEGETADVGLGGVVRMAPRSQVAGLGPDSTAWRLTSDTVSALPVDVPIWRHSVHERDGILPAALREAHTAWREGDIARASGLLQAWLGQGDAEAWPPPATWQAWELMADLRRLAGDDTAATAAVAKMTAYRPCLMRPGTGRREAVPIGVTAAEAGIPLALTAAVQAIVDGRMADAMVEADRLVMAEPRSAAVWGAAARVYLEGSRADLAEAALRRCLLQRARQPEPPAWFPELATIPEGLLGRLFLALDMPRRALDWFLPNLVNHPGDAELALMTLAAAWEDKRLDAVAQVIRLLAAIVPEADRQEFDEALAAAAGEFSWPAQSLAQWQGWLADGGPQLAR